jgi:hypothetical protein
VAPEVAAHPISAQGVNVANASIFQQFLQPARSAADYQNDYQKADAQRTQNALQALTLQQQQAATAQSLDDRNALQRVAAQSGGTREGMIAGLRNSGRATLMAQADAMEKSGADLATSQSVAAKNNQETAKGAYDLHQSMVTHGLQSVLAASTPQLAAQSAADGVQQGYWSMADAQKKIAAIPQDPAQYAQWRLQQLGALVSAKDQLEASKPVLGTTNTGGATNYTSRDPITGAVTTNGSVAMTATPGEQLQAQTTRRGQDLTNSRAVDAMSKPFEVTGPDGTPVLVQQDKTGTITPVSGFTPKGAGATPKLNEGQGKATTFAARMADAESTIDALEKKGVSGTDMRTLAAGSGLTNWAASPEGQDYRQAQENWVTANLRQESGAAIGKDEMDKDVRKFFPAPGDGDSVKAQKARARAVAKEGMLVQAGPGAQQVPGILSRAGSAGSSAPAPATAGVPADIAAILAKHGGK